VLLIREGQKPSLTQQKPVLDTPRKVSNAVITRERIDQLYEGLSLSSWRQTKERRQHTIQDRFCVPSRSVRLCSRCSIAHTIPIEFDTKTKKANYSQLVVCKNKGICPVCSPRQRSKMAKGVEKVLNHHLNQGGSAYCLTLTINSSSYESVSEGFDLLAASWNGIMSGRHRKKLEKQYGLQHYFKAIDNTFSIERFKTHLHIHAALLFRAPLTKAQEGEVRNKLIGDWCRVLSLQSAGKNEAYRSLQRFEPIYGSNGATEGKSVAQYLLKSFGDAAKEITGSWEKKGRVFDSFSLWELLDIAGELDDEDMLFERIRALVNDFARHAKGRIWFSQSRSFKELLELLEDEGEEGEKELIVEVPKEIYRASQNFLCSSIVLEAVERKGAALQSFLAQVEAFNHYDEGLSEFFSTGVIPAILSEEEENFLIKYKEKASSYLKRRYAEELVLMWLTYFYEKPKRMRWGRVRRPPGAEGTP